MVQSSIIQKQRSVVSIKPEFKSTEELKFGAIQLMRQPVSQSTERVVKTFRLAGIPIAVILFALAGTYPQQIQRTSCQKSRAAEKSRRTSERNFQSLNLLFRESQLSCTVCDSCPNCCMKGLLGIVARNSTLQHLSRFRVESLLCFKPIYGRNLQMLYLFQVSLR